jgi:hypothetical protein
MSSFNPKDSLRFAGDVNVDKVLVTTSRGVAQNVMGQMLQLQIFEDLFSPFITGSLILRDALDLTNVMPFIGEEFLELKVSTPTVPGGILEGRFHIYKMSDRTQIGDRSVAYELHFISIESLVDTNKKVSKVFSGKISDIVPTFVTDKLDGLESNKKFIVEPTRNSIKYISNFWSPVANLTFAAENSISETQSPSFLFFENRDGFNFRSLDSMYSGEVRQKFMYDKYTRDNFPLGGNTLNSLQDYMRIGEYEIPTMHDYMDRLRSGMLSSRLISYDSTKKTYTAKNYSAKARYETQKHLNEHPLFSKNAISRPQAMQIFYPRAYETFTSFGDTTNARILQERISVLKMAEAQKLNISVPGRLDYTVGMLVDVHMTKMQPIRGRETNDEIKDKIISGKYLVTAINHTISSEGHDCHMELSKDSTLKNVDSTTS